MTPRPPGVRSRSTGLVRSLGVIDLRSTPQSVSFSSWIVSASSVCVVTIAAATLMITGASSTPARVCAALAQLGLLALFLRRSVAITGSWFSAGPIVALAWFVLFTLPSIAYAADPSLIQLSGDQNGIVVDTLELVDIGLAATIIGWEIGCGDRSRPNAQRRASLELRPSEVRVRQCVATAVIGFAALAFLIEHGGGLTAYLSHVDKTAGTNAGLTYIFGVAMFLKFAAGMPLVSAWSQARPAGWRALTIFVVVVVALGFVLGSRGTIVIGFLEWLILRSLLWKTPNMRMLLPALIVGSIVIVFVLGAFKRFESYRTAHPGTRMTLTHYLVAKAPGQVVTAYVDNYVDTVRLMGMARQLVPSQAGYEPGYQLLNTVLHPIPSFFRPKIGENPTIKAAFQPGGGYAYAVPLIAGAYLGFGAAGLVVVSLVLGWFTGWIDRRLTGDQCSAVAALVIVCSMVGITLVMRSGIPNGLAFAVIDVVGGAVVAAASIVPRTQPDLRPAAGT